MTDYPLLYDGVTPAVEGFIRSFCRWHIAPSFEETVTFMGWGSGILLLPSLHVTEVSEVLIDGVALPSTSYTVTESGILNLSYTYRWPSLTAGLPAVVSVTFTHGYEECPAEIVAAGAKIPQLAGGSVRVGQVQVTAPTLGGGGEDPYTGGVLGRYRRIV